MSINRFSAALRTLCAAALCLGATIAQADGIAIQNANYDATGRQIIVKGKLDGFNGRQTVTVRNLATGVVLGTKAATKQFSFFIPVPAGTAVPCELQVRAGAVVKSTEVRHGPGLCARYTVQLTGTVTDAPIPNALVTVTVDGITYTTTADANGNYTLPITTANLNQLLKIEAAGTSQTGTPIEFTNLIGSFSRVLDEQASTGQAKGNVTNVTTASYVLVLQANDGQEPSTEEQLRSAETAVDATKLLQLAAIIKLIVDEGYALPPGETNLIDFISDPEAVTQYVATTLSTPAAQQDLNAAVGAILADSNLVAGFSAQDIPERYFAIPAANPGYMARSGNILEFDSAANTGRLLDYFAGQGRSVNLPYTWQIASGRLRVDFAQPIVDTYQDVADSPALAGLLTPAEQSFYAGELLNVVQRTKSYTFTRLNDGVLADPVLREADTSLQVLPTQTSKGQFNGTQEVDRTVKTTDLLRSSLDIQPIPFAGSCPSGGKSVCVPGTWSSFAVYSPGNDFRFITGTAGAVIPVTAWGDLQTFTGAGSGPVTGAISGVSATWAVSADGTLTVTYPSGWVQRMQVIENQGLEYGVFHEFTRGAERFATYNINVKANAGFSFTAPYLANAAGEIWQGEVNSWSIGNLNQDGTRPIRSYFGWRFTAVDDSALNLNGLFENETCDPDGLANDLYASLSLGKRTVTADGRVVIDRTGNGTRFRSWYPIASTTVGGDRQFYVLESELRNGLVFIAPRLNLLREIPVPQWKCSNLSP
jgi:hypothetical protein